uniref:Uncharacterized protein n=1 Tax=Panagrolaimus sp. JU765 TaxID=591449 RepID=A0AC34RM22_9BILA
MLSSFLFFAIFCSFISAKLLPDVATCGQAVHSLDAGDMIKVQSTQFPTSLTSSQTSGNISCVITFTRNDGKNNGVQFIFTNGYTLGYLFDTPNGLLNAEGFGKKQQKENEPAAVNFYDSNRNIQFANAQNSSSLTYHYGINGGGMEYSAFEAFVYIPEDGEQMNSCWMNGKTFN